MLIEALIAACLVGAAVTFMVPDRYAGKVGLAASLVPLGIATYMFATFEASGNALMGGQLAFEEQFQWVTLGEAYALNWHVGLDGISMPLVALSTVLTSLAILSAWTPIDERQSQFYGLVLFMEAALLGVFSALDFFVWFVFWEGVLVPMYVLIGVWGGPRRKYAAIKFFVYTNVASLAMFIAFVALVFGLGDAVDTFDMPAIAAALGETGIQADAVPVPGLDVETFKILVFAALFFGFGVKVPVVPWHTWLPDAHVEAPTPVSVLLAGVLLKMGTYAMLRFNFTMLADVARDPNVAVAVGLFAAVSVIYGAMLALAQSDLKRIVAYSSVSSMGYVILGLIALTVYGVGGATFQMVSHGLISGLLFMVVGVIYNQTHTRMVQDMSGLADRMPVTVGVFVAGAFAYMGLPLMSGFAGEFFVFVGSFGSPNLPSSPVFTAVSMFGIVVVAGYLLWAMQRTLFGPFRLETDYELGRAPVQDVLPLLALLALVVLLGVAPDLAFEMIRDAVNPMVGGEVSAALGGGA
ncbi:oxidoreductase [Halobacteriales archaeon QS_8_69_26]|nr:MAG: oxidoreductase [Halobacteriales archaeon QS_8_69_26]